jgi:putative transposase
MNAEREEVVAGGTAAPPIAGAMAASPSVNPAREAAGPPEQDRPVHKRPAHLPNVERHNQPAIVFVTVCAGGRKAVLACARAHHVLTTVWSEARQYTVGCYLIMPDHIHLFCSPAVANAENVKHWVAHWKRLASIRLRDLQPLWQRDCWDTQLRHVDHYAGKWEYVCANPVRKGLAARPGDWPHQGCLNELRW